MIILVQDREDNLHLVDYTNRGRKWTLCGLVYLKKDIINTLALDDTAHNICKKCRAEHDKQAHRIDARYSKGTSQFRLLSKSISLTDARSPWDKYWYLVDRYSEKIALYQRKITRKT